MPLHSDLLVGSAALAVSVVVWLAWLHHTGKKKAERPKRVVNKVLFFPDQANLHQLAVSNSHKTPNASSSVNSTSQRSDKADVGKEGSMWELFKSLQQARHTIAVCVFNIASSELCDVLIVAHQAGVIVRVVTNNEQMLHSGNQVNRLRAAGIQVRVDETEYFMHHKFAVVDGALLLTGSLNWTTQGLCGNQENVILTSEPALVQPFSKQFEVLWTKYDPVPQPAPEKAASERDTLYTKVTI